MLKNYFKIALRQLSRNTGYSFINIVGLSVGLACFILIATYVIFELSYDNFHEKGARIFRLTSKGSFGGEAAEFDMTPTAAYPTFTREFPEVETGVRIYDVSGFSPRVVEYKDKLFEEKGFLYVDSTFFDIFSFEIVRGNPETVLDDLNSVVITESMAEKYFGNEDPLDKTITTNGTTEYKVTGVVEDPPANSQIKFSFLASFHSLSSWRREIWGSANFITYLQLNDPAAAPQLEKKIRSYMDQAFGEDMPANSFLTYVLQPIRDVHLRARVESSLQPNSDIRYVYIFAAIALLILAIACINYMNLATARAAERAREVGIRKVVGAEQRQLFQQFLGESTIVTFIALLLGLFGAYFLLPGFNQLTDRNMSFIFFENPTALMALVGIGVLVSLIAGSYPAIMISGFQPIRVLKGDFKTSGSGIALRKGLVIFQFAVSTFLIVSTIVVQNQLSFIQNKKLGYSNDQVVVLGTDSRIRENIIRFRDEFSNIPNVKSVALGTETPTFIQGGYSLWAEGKPQDFRMGTRAMAVDNNYIPTLDMSVVAGSNFTAADFADVNTEEGEEKYYHFILNESAARELGWAPEEALGKRANLNGREGEIKGVVEDFHFASLHEAIGPLVMFIDNQQLNKILLKLDGSNISSTLAAMEDKWKQMAPHRPFDYQFLDQEFDALYSAEERTGSLAATFAILAILIACLGLLGLTAFAAQQRTKEIGIRKVLGASVANIVGLLSKDFLVLVLISMLIAFPVAWWAMSSWLEDFVYRINISWWIFALAGIAALAIALVTVASQAIRAANSDPVNSLRSE
jgi:putative ABC transport system permease protein